MSSVHQSLRAFVEQARWFGGKGRPFEATGVRRLGVLGDGSPTLVLDLVSLTYSDEEGGQEFYQVPLACYPEPQEHLGHALVGSWDDADAGPSYVYDAVHDRESMAHLLAAFHAPPPYGPLHFERLPGHDLDVSTHSTL